MSTGEEERAGAEPLGERVYKGVKAYVMTIARPGQRLDLTMLGERQQASLTPVRAALHRLAGEGLVEAHLNAGFRAPPLSLGGLRDLYDWNRRILIEAAAPELDPVQGWWVGFKLARRPDVVADVARLFRTLVRRIDNMEAERAVDGLNDRLHRVRMIEIGVLGDGVEELRQMAACLSEDRVDELQDVIELYHMLRENKAAEVVKAADKLGRSI